MWKSCDHWKSTDHIRAGQGGKYIFGYLSHGGGFTKKSDNLSPSEKNTHSRVGAKVSKTPPLRALSLHIYSPTRLCLAGRQLGISITVGPFSETAGTSVHSAWHCMVLPLGSKPSRVSFGSQLRNHKLATLSTLVGRLGKFVQTHNSVCNRVISLTSSCFLKQFRENIYKPTREGHMIRKGNSYKITLKTALLIQQSIENKQRAHKWVPITRANSINVNILVWQSTVYRALLGGGQTIQGISLYYFSQLHMNLQVSQWKIQWKYDWQNIDKMFISTYIVQW